MPASLDAKILWKVCLPYGRLVDAFSANKLSKRGQRFGFIRFLGVTDANERVQLLSIIWISSYHIYISIARFRRTNIKGSHANPNVVNPTQYSNPKPTPKFTPSNHTEPQPVNSLFASVIHSKPEPTSDPSASTTVHAVVLNDNDLICVADSSTIIMLKLRDMDTMSNMYMICRNEDFMDMNIHHVGGLWIWIRFPSSITNIIDDSLDASSNFDVNDIDMVADSVKDNHLIDDLIDLHVTPIASERISGYGYSYKKDLKIVNEDSWSDSDESAHEEMNESCLMAFGSQE
ncbi:RNA-directed DNA polymerase, eukaryota, partial [Tanacetum coccineum]